MTDQDSAGHTKRGMLAIGRELFSGTRADSRRTNKVTVGQQLSFESVYDAHFDFVWRSVRRLGVPDSQVDDAVQDVFVVAYRRLPDFEGRSKLKTWLFGIALKVAKSHRRRIARKGQLDPLPGELVDDTAPQPDSVAEKNQAIALLDKLLEALDEDKRAVFVLAELEGMTAPEMAEALGVNVNTVYSRLRAARRGFNEAVKRHRARERSVG